MTEPAAPSVLFVCVKNGGKSQMAAGLMRSIAGDRVTVDPPNVASTASTGCAWFATTSPAGSGSSPANSINPP